MIAKLQMTTAGKNMKSCDQNEEAFQSHDYTKFKFRSIIRLAAFAIPVGDIDSLVIFVIRLLNSPMYKVIDMNRPAPNLQLGLENEI